jgi:hypothetical protein
MMPLQRLQSGRGCGSRGLQAGSVLGIPKPRPSALTCFVLLLLLQMIYLLVSFDPFWGSVCCFPRP